MGSVQPVLSRLQGPTPRAGEYRREIERPYAQRPVKATVTEARSYIVPTAAELTRMEALRDYAPGWTPERKMLYSERMRRHWTEENRRRRSERAKVHWKNLPDDEKARRVAKMVAGQRWTDEARQAMSVKSRAHWDALSDEEKAKRCARMRAGKVRKNAQS